MIPPCSGGRSSNVGLRYSASSASSAPSIPWSSRDPVRQRAVEFDHAVAQHERRRRIATDEGEPGPPLGSLDRLEEESGTVADELDVGRHRRLEVGQLFGPHWDDRVGRGVRVEVVACRKELHQPNCRKKQVRAPV